MAPPFAIGTFYRKSSMNFTTGTGLAIAFTLLLAAGPAAANRTVGENIDDATLTAQTKLALVEDPAVEAGAINVESYKGTVLLIGWVDSKQQKRAALERAATVDNVRDVVDALRIKRGERSFGRAIDDETVHARAKLKLAQTKGLGEAVNVVIRVHDGKALLGGFIDTEDAVDHIGDAIREVDGVEKVYNELRVRE